MVDRTGKTTIQSEGKQYAQITDVQDILRSFNFTTDSNPSEETVNNIIQKKTRYVEKELPTAFRELEVEDIYIDAVGSSKQRRKGIKSRTGTGIRTRGNIESTLTTDKWVEIQLPHYFIQSLNKLTLYSSTGMKEIDLDDPEQDDIYRLKEREGVLLVDHTYFPLTASGTAGSDRMIDTEVKVRYEYGRTFVEDDITEAVAKLTVYELINSDAFSEIRSEDDTFIDLEVFTQRLKDDAEDILENYRY